MATARKRQPPPPTYLGDDPVADLDAALRDDGVPLLLSLKQVAEVAGVHYQTAWDAVACGILKAHKQGGRWRVMRRDLARWSLHNARDTLTGNRREIE